MVLSVTVQKSHFDLFGNCTFCAFVLAPLRHYNDVSGCRVL